MIPSLPSRAMTTLPRRRALCIASAFCCIFLWGAAKCQNNAPDPEADFAANTGRLIYVDVLANDSEPDGEWMKLTVTGGTCSSAGDVTVEDNLVRFQPIPGVPSSCTVIYRVEDPSGSFVTQTLTFSAVDGTLIFSDGFELGHAGAWSSCVGC